MKIAALSATALAAVVASAAATPSVAQDYRGYVYERAAACQDKTHDSGTTGAVLGGIAGALIGSNLASHHGGRAGGAALGAVAGALVGNSIGRSTAKSSEVCDGGSYGRAFYRAQPAYYGQPAYHGYYDRADYRGHQPYRYRGYDPYGY